MLSQNCAFPQHLAESVRYVTAAAFGIAPAEALMEASVMSRDVPSRGGPLPIFHCAPDLIAHMLIVLGWYLCLSQPPFFYCRLSMSCRFMPVARVQLPDRGSNATTTDGKWLVRVTAFIYLYFKTKWTDAACVLQGDRMIPTESLASFSIFFLPFFGTSILFFCS